VITEAVKTIGVTETTYFRWRAVYGGMKSDQLKRLKHEAVSIVQMSPLRDGPAGVIAPRLQRQVKAAVPL
jgi:hypothetical protein